MKYFITCDNVATSALYRTERRISIPGLFNKFFPLDVCYVVLGLSAVNLLSSLPTAISFAGII